jgi:hypothetical protein
LACARFLASLCLLAAWRGLAAPEAPQGPPEQARQKAGGLNVQPPSAKAPEGKGRDKVTDEDRKFWSFQPLQHPKPPAVKNKSWARNDIDRFILSRLEAKKLRPNPIVDRRKLIRRASFDLVGLPPTPEEVETFVNDQSPEAYEQLIDRLLASPHYGERWGRHWLDLARFAESHGYEQDYDRPNAYHYRDFVIRALNDDLPYDRFVSWQIAGDELEPDNLLAMQATGYLAAGTHATQITANQAEKERYDELDDMAATIGTSMLGLTVGCARCHDHKFDPIPTQDYYRLISTFTTTVRSDYDVLVDPAKYRREKAGFDREHQPLVDALRNFEETKLSARLTAWEKTGVRPPLPEWLVLDHAEAKSKGKAAVNRQEDGSFLFTGENPDFDAYTFTVPAPVTGITAVKLEALPDKSMKKNGPGRADNGNFALSDFKLSVLSSGSTNTVDAKFTKATASFEQKGLPVAAAIDADKKSAWAIDPRFGTNQAAVFELAAPLTNAGTLTFTLKFDNNNKHTIGRPRLSVTTRASPGLDGSSGPALVAEVIRILDLPATARSDAQQATLLKWYRTEDAEWRQLNRAVVEHAKKEPQPEKTKVLISSEGVPAVRLHTQGPDFYEKTYFLKRGDLNQKQGEAPPGFLQVLMRAPEAGKRWQTAPPSGAHTSYRRASLARWITDTDAGAGQLLARVMVNRLWQHHFGRGIVATPSDFGSQGARPTHPELLDWLAGELIRDGWHLKPLHKLIMTSAAYMENDDWDEARNRLDPDNALLWRRAPQRLEGEIIRDAMLAVSGRLDRTRFGPGTLDENQTRRSIYFMVKRSKMIPMLSLFDAPDSLQSLGCRQTTTIAPQALALLNNKQVIASASTFAKSVMAETSGPLGAVQRAYLRALGRAPSKEEIWDSSQFIQQQTEVYTSEKKERPMDLAVADFCQALFSLNEFVYVD